MEHQRISSTRNRTYEVILFLIIASAVFANALRDLNNLQEITAKAQAVAAELIGFGFPTIYAAEVVSVPGSTCEAALVQDETRAAEFRWSGLLQQGKTLDIKGVNGSIKAELSPTSNVQVVATKRARKSNPASVDIRVLEHEAGVTICVLYPSDDPANPNTCEPGKRGRMNVRNNDVSVDFMVGIPAGVNFNGRTVNGEISATSLASNLSLYTVNGSIKLSTSGYARAKTVNGEISAALGDANWPENLEFNTVNGGITLDLPAHISADVRADTFNGEIVNDFPLAVVTRVSRKHLRGTIGAGGRELILKTLNGSINLRRAG